MTEPARRNAVPHARPGLAGRTIGLVALTVAIVGGLALVALLNGGNAASSTAADDTPPAPLLGENLDQQGESIEGMFIQLVDENDPSRVVGEITAASFNPVDPGNREVVEPRAVFVLKDGRTVRIEADGGRFFIPPGTNQPEEGVLRGNVRVRLFDPAPDGARANPDADTPALDARFDQPLRFDLRLGELSTPGRLEITGPQIEFAGTKVRAVLNQARQRIILLEVDRGERLVYRPGVDATPIAHRPRTSTPTPAAPSSTPNAPTITRVQATAPNPDPAIDLYRAIFRDGVTGEQLGRQIAADRLDIWVRLIDRRFPVREDRVSTRQPASWTGTPLDIILAAALAQPNANANTNANPNTAPATTPIADADAPVTLRWTGPLRLDLLDETAPPPELEGEDLALRFTAEQTGLVTFADADANASGAAVAAEYRDGSRRLVLSGPAGTVRLESPDAGRIEGVSQMAVAFDQGNVNVRGPGVLASADHEGDNPDTGRRRIIRWTEQADFDFALEDGAMTDRLTEARFIGRVVANADDAELQGSAVTALFANDADTANTAITTATNPGSRLEQLRVTDALGQDGRGGSLAGDDMRVFFDTTVADAQPTRVFVEGSVRGGRDDGASIRADLLDAALDREPSGRIVVARVEAEGSVTFGDGRDITATTERMVARPPLELATLVGEGSSIRRGASVVSGPRIELEGRDGVMRIEGAGRLIDEQPARGDTAARTVDLTWSGLLNFDDAAGDAVVIGDVTGTLESTSTSGDLAIDTVRADRVRVRMSPAGERPADTDADDRTIGGRVERVTVFGRGSSTEQPARVEARRYGPAAPSRPNATGNQADAPRALGPLQRVIALDANEIILLAAEERVVVPGPGLLVSLQNPETPNASIADDARVLVEWIGGMELDRRGGSADLFNQVQVVHFRPDTATTTELETERLRLFYRDREERAGELVSLDAAGAAWLRSGPREMLADRILYNADTGLARASANEGNAVTLFDGDRGTSVRATKLEWDLFRDTLTFDRPSGVSAPR